MVIVQKLRMELIEATDTESAQYAPTDFDTVGMGDLLETGLDDQ